jgi:hypothetical protein
VFGGAGGSVNVDQISRPTVRVAGSGVQCCGIQLFEVPINIDFTI